MVYPLVITLAIRQEPCDRSFYERLSRVYKLASFSFILMSSYSVRLLSLLLTAGSNKAIVVFPLSGRRQ